MTSTWGPHDTVIIDIARSAIGRANKGSLIDVRPDDLAAQVVAKLMERNEGVNPRDLADLICGASGGAGEQAMNVGRAIGLLSGLPNTVPALTVNRFCASSLQAARMGHHALQAGEGEAYLIVGVESCTRRGVAVQESDFNPRFVDQSRDDFVAELFISMGETAERVAEKYNVSREEQDEYAVRSHKLALAARERGTTAKEIVAVQTPSGDLVEIDDGPRPNSTMEALANLRTVFRENGTVTAGNACPLNDGAAAMIITTGAYAQRNGLTPRAKIIGTSVSGLEPELMGLGPISASKQLLAQLNMSPTDIDAVEVNEAFAAQVLPSIREVGFDLDSQVNLNGGAIALGHPFGMTGLRLISTLLHGLEERDQQTGVTTLCVGGGQGMALAIERV